MRSLPPDRAPNPPAGAQVAAPAPAALGGARRVSSEQLFPAGSAELLIDHRGSLYRLKQTSLGKLILTK